MKSLHPVIPCSPCLLPPPLALVSHFTTQSRNTLLWYWHPRSRHPSKPHLFSSISCSSFRRRPRRSRRLGNNSYTGVSSYEAKPIRVDQFDDESVKLTIDFDNLSARVRTGVDQFVYRGTDAYEDLSTLVTFSETGKMVVSCRRSTGEFVGALVVLSFVSVFVFRVLVSLGSGFSSQFKGRSQVVVRRDRSMGGREVVIGMNNESEKFRAVESPLSPGRGSLERVVAERRKRNFKERFQTELPQWWPASIPGPSLEVDKEEFQREANRLVRVIVDNRLHGKDIVPTDIIQLRRICRISGICISFGATNTRDSFFRTSVDFVLNHCAQSELSAVGRTIDVEVDGDDPRTFIAGLAENIGLENLRAARIVSAAIAARTLSSFLQAWALEMQGEHSGSLLELSKICVLHRIFPPEDHSPEMEMVALGLKKQLKPDQREFLMNMLIGLSGEEIPQSLTEALGLAPSNRSGVGDQEESVR